MAKLELDTSLIRESKPQELVAYFDRLQSEGFTGIAICQALFKAVDAELPPFPLLNVFLTWTYYPVILVASVKHGPGVSVRRLALRQAGKLLANPDTWEPMWVALGRVQGLVALFAASSVMEVKLLSRVIGYCGTRQTKVAAREKVIEELLKALLPRSYPESPIRSEEKRPVQHHYARMLQACSADFVNSVLEAQDDSNPLYQRCSISRLIKAHSGLMQKRAEAGVLGPGSMSNDARESLETFLYRDTEFAANSVQLLLKNKDHERWPHTVDELDVIMFHLKRMLKRRGRPDSEIRPMILLALQVAEEKQMQNSQHRCPELWSIICTRWWRQPKLYENLFVRAMRIDLEGHPANIGHHYFVRSDGKARVRTWNWTLLRYYCLYGQEKGIDLDTATDYTPFAKQPWATEIFFEISRVQAKRVLSSLYDANLNYNFLDPGHGSILQFREIRSSVQKNFNVDLILAMLNRGDEKALQNAKTAVDKLRQKASASREQSDRAENSKAASFYAIASGDLDLYRETIVWQQRFIRDPLTIKTIYSQESVMSNEGIELLCGIPERSPEGINLSEIAARIEKGNSIIIAFHEAMLLAKREPSFYDKDWNGVNSLAGAVLNKRVSHAEKLQEKEFRDKKGDVFMVIWESSMVLVDKLHQDCTCIQPLFLNLPPASLAAATKIMLDSGSERRKRQNRQTEDDALERMSYAALVKLASGEKPELAKQLILRTVLERPDASAWHRQLLSVGFMKKIPAEDAQNMLLAFAAAIGEKLEEQSYVKVGAPEPSKTAPPASIVKVTTVKYLAQMLDNAEYISANAAIDVLVELFRTGQHRDIRLATLDSLLSSLNDICNGAEETWRSNPLTEKILGALETAIPVVGSINEHRPPRKEDWQEAIEKGSLPEIPDTPNEPPPLLMATLTPASTAHYSNLKKLQPEFVKRLILPVLALSQEQHQRWVTLFLAKYKADIDPHHIPPTPVTPLVWETVLMRYPHLLPPEVFEDYYQYIRTTFSLSSDLKKFNESLKSNSSLRNVSEVQHWLRIFGQKADSYYSSGLSQILAVTEILYEQGSSFSRGVEMATELVSVMLDNYEDHINTWTGLVQQLQPPLEDPSRKGAASSVSQSRVYRVWKATLLPILEKTTTLLLDKKRSKSGDQALGTMFPSAVELQVLLLPYPLSRDKVQAEAERKVFAEKLDDLILSNLQGEKNILQWSKVASATCSISKLLSKDEERLQLASHIGQLKKPETIRKASAQLLSALNLVKIRTASTLIQDGWGIREVEEKWEAVQASDKKKSPEKERKTEQARKVKHMVQEWQRCTDESVVEELMEWRRERLELWTSLTKS